MRDYFYPSQSAQINATRLQNAKNIRVPFNAKHTLAPLSLKRAPTRPTHKPFGQSPHNTQREMPSSAHDHDATLASVCELCDAAAVHQAKCTALKQHLLSFSQHVANASATELEKQTPAIASCMQRAHVLVEKLTNPGDGFWVIGLDVSVREQFTSICAELGAFMFRLSTLAFFDEAPCMRRNAICVPLGDPDCSAFSLLVFSLCCSCDHVFLFRRHAASTARTPHIMKHLFSVCILTLGFLP